MEIGAKFVKATFVEQKIKLITIVISIYELVMEFFHGQIRVSYYYTIGT